MKYIFISILLILGVIFSLPAKWDYPPNFRQIFLIANFESSFPADEGAQRAALKAANATLVSANNEVQISARRPQWCDLVERYPEAEQHCSPTGKSVGSAAISIGSAAFDANYKKPSWCDLFDGQYAEAETNCENSGQSLFKILDECEIFIKRGRKTEWQERLKPAWEKIQSGCMTVLLEFKRDGSKTVGPTVENL